MLTVSNEFFFIVVCIKFKEDVKIVRQVVINLYSYFYRRDDELLQLIMELHVRFCLQQRQLF